MVKSYVCWWRHRVWWLNTNFWWWTSQFFISKAYCVRFHQHSTWKWRRLNLRMWWPWPLPQHLLEQFLEVFSNTHGKFNGFQLQSRDLSQRADFTIFTSNNFEPNIGLDINDQIWRFQSVKLLGVSPHWASPGKNCCLCFGNQQKKHPLSFPTGAWLSWCQWMMPRYVKHHPIWLNDHSHTWKWLK